ncbi:MAG TPA: ECF-type sigma factor [Kofleriaceae bacterium]
MGNRTPIEKAAGAPADRFSELLQALANGDRDALRLIVPLVYTKLRRIARYQLARERQGHTLDSVALVNEVFLTLVAQDELVLNNRAHFLAVSAKAMRRILVDHARRRNARKRGDGIPAVSLEGLDAASSPVEVDARILALNAALDRLSVIDPQAATIVEQRYFAGATEHEIARGLGMSAATVRRRWAFAKAWLLRELRVE